MLKAIVISGILGIFVLGCCLALFALVYDQPKDVPSIRLNGSDMFLHRGNGHSNGRKLIVTDTDKEQRIRIISKPISFRAEDMPFMAWTFSNLSPRSGVWVAWVTKQNPQQLNMEPAIIPFDSTAVYLMKNNPDWQGEIVTLGFGFDGQMHDPVILDSIEIRPYSIGSMLESIWDGWTAFEGWSLKSINIIKGSGGTTLIRPTPIVFMWVVIASLIYMLLQMNSRNKQNLEIAVLYFVTGWALLDIKWQIDLWRQNYVTYHSYVGKTLDQKRLVGKDRRLFIYSQEIKNIIPDNKVRVFLTGNGIYNNFKYEHHRLQYFLMPYNVSYFENHYAVYSRSSKEYKYESNLGEYIDKGEYVIVLGISDRLHFDKMKQTIVFGKGRTFKAKQLLDSENGSIYKIISIID